MIKLSLVISEMRKITLPIQLVMIFMFHLMLWNDSDSVSNILSCSTLPDFFTEMTFIIFTLNMLKAVDSYRTLFENMVWYFQKCFGIWKGARILQKNFITMQKIHLPEKI